MGAYVTVIGPGDGQVEYRLTGQSGCGEDAKLGYYLNAPERPLRWVGRGAEALGLTEGGVLDPPQYDMARAVMRGARPTTGEQLVVPKTSVSPQAMLPSTPLLDAVLLQATRNGVSPEALWTTKTAAEEWGRLVRGVRRRGEAHRIAVQRATRLLDAAGVGHYDAYDQATFDEAARHAEDRVVVGNRGYDLTVTLGKSFSVFSAFTDDTTARELEDLFIQAGDDTLAYAEDIAGYGMRGHHGDGRTARRVQGNGLIGWVNIHRTARSTIDGAPGDPHLHAHYTVANLVQGADGKWSTVAAGGRDLMRHSKVLGEFMNARARRLSQHRLGLSWARDPLTGEWEITGITRQAIDLFSKRGVQVNELLAELGLTLETATAAQHRVAGQATRAAKNAADARRSDPDLRRYWHTEARAAGIDPHQLVAAVDAARGPAPARPSEDEIATIVYHPETGVTSREPDFTRSDMLAAIADALPDGVVSSAELEGLTDRILARAEAVAMPLRPGEPAHLTNAARYTTRDLVDASIRIVENTAAGLGAGRAVASSAATAMAEQVHELANGYPLSVEQRAVYHRLVHAGHGVDVVIGVAGSGKTTLTAVARAAWEAAGFTVRGATVAAVGADNLRDAGVPSTTIASLLHPNRPLVDKLSEIDVLVIDEAGQVGVRDLDQILSAAAHAGTKVVQIGDPKQLGSVTPGGALPTQHDLVAGLTLTENRRQTDTLDREAAAAWRTGRYHDAIHARRAGEGVTVTHARIDALRAAVTGWATDRDRVTDRYDQIGENLLLAVRREDVADLNTAARALARAAGRLSGPDRLYRLAGGRSVALAVGDVVMTRVNDYRTWRDAGPDVLNGRRGYVDHINARTGELTLSWRAEGRIHHATITPDYIAAGGLQHGYAMTIYKAQGQTTTFAHTYGVGLDAATGYVAQTRHRHHARLYLPLAAMVDPTEFTLDQIAALTDTERADLATGLLAEAAERTRTHRLVTDELADARYASGLHDDAPPRHPARLTDHPRSADPPAQIETYLDGVHSDLASRLRVDPALPALTERLHMIAQRGADPTQVLADAIAQQELHTARSPAQVLHWRLTGWLDHHDASTPETVPLAPRSDQAASVHDTVQRLRAARATANRAHAAGEQAAPDFRDPESPDATPVTAHVHMGADDDRAAEEHAQRDAGRDDGAEAT